MIKILEDPIRTHRFHYLKMKRFDVFLFMDCRDFFQRLSQHEVVVQTVDDRTQALHVQLREGRELAGCEQDGVVDVTKTREQAFVIRIFLEQAKKGNRYCARCRADVTHRANTAIPFAPMFESIAW